MLLFSKLWPDSIICDPCGWIFTVAIKCDINYLWQNWFLDCMFRSASSKSLEVVLELPGFHGFHLSATQLGKFSGFGQKLKMLNLFSSHGLEVEKLEAMLGSCKNNH